MTNEEREELAEEWSEYENKELGDRAHSPRSRLMVYDYNNPWHGTHKKGYREIA